MDTSRLLLRVPEAASAIGVGRSKCYAMIASGDIPSVSLPGGQVRVPVDALKAWIAERTTQPAGAQS